MRYDNRRPRVQLWLLLIAATAAFISVPASAQDRRSVDGVGVTVFVNPNFNGQSATFRADTPTLVPYGLNDKISSIQIPSGETWEVCQDINYANQCQVLSGNVSDLRAMGWSDKISSLRRVGVVRPHRTMRHRQSKRGGSLAIGTERPDHVGSPAQRQARQPRKRTRVWPRPPRPARRKIEIANNEKERT